MKQQLSEEREVLLSLCEKMKLKLISEHEYSLSEGDIQRVIYVIEN